MAKTAKKQDTQKTQETEEEILHSVQNDKTESAAKTYTEAEVTAMVNQAVAQAVAVMQQNAALQQTPKSERVQLLWQAEVAEDNVQEFGENGIYARITGKTGSFFVPKDEFSRILDSMTRLFLDRRWLIVVSGLDEAEREALGVNYKDGEYLDQVAFAKMVELGNGLLDIYPKLCAGHREIVANRLYEAWTQRNANVTRELVRELYQQSKALGAEEMTFKKILEEMNAAEVCA